MICAQNELLAILPLWLRPELNESVINSIQEIRIRLRAPVEMVLRNSTKWIKRNVTKEDIQFCINAASRYSPWNAASASQGFLTASGGHRIGICGEAVCKDGQMSGIRDVTSLCIRVAKDFSGISEGIPINGSLLILGAPGWGKTTLLRDLIRRISQAGDHVAVVDERHELFPSDIFDHGPRTDILLGCSKGQGIDAVLRTMGPDWIAMDEITGESDCNALLRTGWCGVKLLATAHAASYRDYISRPVYRALVDSRLFDTIVVLKKDKTWCIERSRQ